MEILFYQESLQGSGHGVKRAAQLGELVGAGNADAVVQIAAIDVLGCTVEIGDRCCDGPAQPYRHPQGQQFDDREDQA
jgi:hypothetical protein